jgi:hypothetical protein
MCIIDLLLDEIWISILSEWIGNQEILLALDNSLVNRVIRERYSSCWLKNLKTVSLNISFNVSKHRCSKFVTWCERRKIFPRDICFVICMCSDTTELTALTVPKGKELVKDVHIEFSPSKYSISLESLLVAFPACETMSLCESSLGLSFTQFPEKHRVSMLKEIQFSHIFLPLDLSKWKAFAKYCPSINELYFAHCHNFESNMLMVLMNHLPYLKTVCCILSNFTYSSPSSEEMTTYDCITTLYFEFQESSYDIDDDTDAGEGQMILTILRNCPRLQALSLKYFTWTRTLIASLKELMPTSWINLRSLCLENIDFGVRNLLNDADEEVSFFEQLSITCRSSLQHLRLDETFVDILCDIVPVVTRSFPKLFSLFITGLTELHDYTTNFATAPFQSTLTKLTLLLPMDYSFTNVLPWYVSLKQVNLNLVPETITFDRRSVPFGSLPYVEQLEKVSIISNKNSYRCFSFCRLNNLTSLEIGCVRLQPEDMRAILRLPKLTTLCICQTYSIKPITLFQETSYPSKNAQELAPLKEIDLHESDIRFTEHKIMLLLQRFPNLRSIRLREISMSKKAFQELKQRYFHRVNIFTFETLAKKKRTKNANRFHHNFLQLLQVIDHYQNIHNFDDDYSDDDIHDEDSNIYDSANDYEDFIF